MVAQQITETKRILFEDIAVKWIWRENELLYFREMWNAGENIKHIARELGTNKRSVALLVMDQAELGEIAERTGGLFGN